MRQHTEAQAFWRPVLLQHVEQARLSQRCVVRTIEKLFASCFLVCMESTTWCILAQIASEEPGSGLMVPLFVDIHLGLRVKVSVHQLTHTSACTSQPEIFMDAQ
jgi:hypothetical protein